jgi:heme oxygenase
MSSGAIFRSSMANKKGLSSLLDSTLRRSHNMKVFGVGAVAELASRESYRHFASQRFHFYNAMETQFDKAVLLQEASAASASASAAPSAPSGTPASSTSHAHASSPKPTYAYRGIALVWPHFSADLRQRPALLEDLAHVGVQSLADMPPPTPATAAYIASIQQASSEALIGHFYCRYFADLFGGSMLGTPTALALALPSPLFYSFPPAVEQQRGAYIESVYERINTAGELMDPAMQEQVIFATEAAFAHNADIIKEVGMLRVAVRAVLGITNVSSAYVKNRVLG